MPLGIAITKKNKFRNQRVTLTVFVPVGKKIKINQAIWNKTSEGRISFDSDHLSDWEDYWGNEERGWTTNIEYIMKADGLYTMNGNPANSEEARKERKNNKSKEPITIKKNGSGITINIDTDDDADDAKERKLDSLERRQEFEKDSINKVIEEKQRKEKEKVLKQVNQPSAYTTPIGLPIINSLM
jgi:hypothetical protein